MNIILNGETVATNDGGTIESLLLQLGISRDRVAVELNTDIVPKTEYENRFLTDNDRIEIVHFVGGGQ